MLRGALRYRLTPAVAALLACLVIAARAATAYDVHKAMVVAEHELAAQAGLKILSRGGNAIDAACAASLAVGVTNPSSCGIGGGGFMLIYLARTGKVYALDYRERAPIAVRAGLYMRDGKPDQSLARSGALAVAVPGEVAGLQAALARFGTMKFSAVAAPAIELARDGFPCGDHLAAETASTAPALARDQLLKAVFLEPDGSPRKAGDKIVEAKLARTLQRLGDKPIENFYQGPVAHELAAYMKQHGGLITAADLEGYKPIWREPLHGPYREFEVYSMPPPSAGGGLLLEMLGMLDSGPLGGLGIDSPPYLARLIEVMRQGFIDREAYGDPDFVKVPIGFLLSPEHIKQARDSAFHRTPRPAAAAPRDRGTAHLCVVDEAGNIVSLTTTINTRFGAKMAVPALGLILNNEMDDFAVAPGTSNAYRLVGTEANSIEPGKRPLSSMTPTIIMKAGKPLLALGGSGGPAIITGVLQLTLDVLDFHLGPERAMEVWRIHEQANPDMVLVEDAMPPATGQALQQMGYKLRRVPRLGSVGAILIAPGLLRGAWDPRKGGGVAGY